MNKQQYICVTQPRPLAGKELIDVSTVASAAGFRCPVRISKEAWQNCVAWSSQDSLKQAYQDEAGRLWNLLFLASRIPHIESNSQSMIDFYRIPRDGKSRHAQHIRLMSVIGPHEDDDGPAIVYIDLAEEVCN